MTTPLKEKVGAGNVSSEMEAALRMLAATNKVARTAKAKKDKPVKTLRAAWAPGGRKKMAVEVEDDLVDRGERSPSPLQEVIDRRERQAEERFNRIMLEAQQAAGPALRNKAISEPAWQTELRLTHSLSNQYLVDRGEHLFSRRGLFAVSGIPPG